MVYMKNTLYVLALVLALLVGLSPPASSLAKEIEPADDRGSDRAIEVRVGMPVPGNDDVVEMEVIDDSSGMSEEHRSEVAKAVQALLLVSDRAGGIGEEIKEVAQEQKSAHNDVSDAISRVEKRNGFITFLFGTDYRNLGKLRSALVTSENGIERLTRAKEKTSDASVRAELDAQISVLQVENGKASAFIEEQEGKMSLFGWLFRLF
jgi:hypothetical protein